MILGYYSKNLKREQEGEHWTYLSLPYSTKNLHVLDNIKLPVVLLYIFLNLISPNSEKLNKQLELANSMVSLQAY